MVELALDRCRTAALVVSVEPGLSPVTPRAGRVVGDERTRHAGCGSEALMCWQFRFAQWSESVSPREDARAGVVYTPMELRGD